MEQVYTLEQIKQIVTPIAVKHNVRRLAVFGSYARGEADEKSDVDLFVDAPTVDTLFRLSSLRLDLEDALGKDVDLVTEQGVASHINDLRHRDFIENLRKDEVELYAG